MEVKDKVLVLFFFFPTMNKKLWKGSSFPIEHYRSSILLVGFEHASR